MRRKQQNSGFSLIELIIALAVLAFLMLAVSSFMGSSVMQSKKERADVKMQTQSQEVYNLITDSIMQANDILIVGYTASDDDDIDFAKPGETTTATLTKKYYVRDKKTAEALMKDPATYGIFGSVSASDIVYFTDLSATTNIYISYMRVTSSVPLDMNQVPGANPSVITDQTIVNSITGEGTVVSCTEQNSKRVYSINDTLISSYYFEDNIMYYGRKYTYMTRMDDVIDMLDTDSKNANVYNKYFSYNVGTLGATSTGVSGCVATINAKDGTIGIDLYYNQSSMKYTTLGRINTRNSYVLKPRK